MVCVCFVQTFAIRQQHHEFDGSEKLHDVEARPTHGTQFAVIRRAHPTYPVIEEFVEGF